MSKNSFQLIELAVVDCETSTRFWCDVLGFELLDERPEQGIAELILGTARVKLIQSALDTSSWQMASLQIPLPDINPQIMRLKEASWPFGGPSEKYRNTFEDVEKTEARTLSVQDPNGIYLEFIEY